MTTVKSQRMTPARKDFNGVNNSPHARMVEKAMTRPVNTPFNPKEQPRGRTKPLSKAELANMDAIVPAGVRVQVLPGFERFEDVHRAQWGVGPAAASVFVDEWRELRGE